MAIELKHLSKDAIARAVEKADRYRLLNEPVQAQSICLDILRTEPDNQSALVILLLALTDQFGRSSRMDSIEPKDVIARLKGAYERAYYAGIVAERQAQAVLDQGAAGSQFVAHDYLTIAMKYFDEAAAIRPSGNDDALLRWNACARMMDGQAVQERGDQTDPQLLE